MIDHVRWRAACTAARGADAATGGPRDDARRAADEVRIAAARGAADAPPAA